MARSLPPTSPFSSKASLGLMGRTVPSGAAAWYRVPGAGWSGSGRIRLVFLWPAGRQRRNQLSLIIPANSRRVYIWPRVVFPCLLRVLFFYSLPFFLPRASRGGKTRAAGRSREMKRNIKSLNDVRNDPGGLGAARHGAGATLEMQGKLASCVIGRLQSFAPPHNLAQNAPLRFDPVRK